MNLIETLIDALPIVAYLAFILAVGTAMWFTTGKGK